MTSVRPTSSTPHYWICEGGLMGFYRPPLHSPSHKIHTHTWHKHLRCRLCCPGALTLPIFAALQCVHFKFKHSIFSVILFEILCSAHLHPSFVILVVFYSHISRLLKKIANFSNVLKFIASYVFEFLRYRLGAQHKM